MNKGDFKDAARDESRSYDMLSDEEVAALHRAFQDKLEARAQAALPQDAQNPGALLGDLLLVQRLALRKGIELRQEELSDLARHGRGALAGRAEALRHSLHVKSPKDQERPSPMLDERQQRQVEQAARVREEAPVVEALFGARERLYLRARPAGPSPTQRDVERYLAKKGYRITDYTAGQATDAAGKQRYRIGRLLAGDPDADWIKRGFESDPARTAGTQLIVISRNADDIANMSTGRAWPSCTGSNGFFWHYVPDDIRNGTLVAYLVSDTDPEVLSPFARQRVLPFGRKIAPPRFNLLRTANEVFLPARRYGLGNGLFTQVVRDFADQNLNARALGEYTNQKRRLYLGDELGFSVKR